MALYSLNGQAINNAYDVIGDIAIGSYDVDGNPLNSHVDYSDYTSEPYCSVSISQMQGFDIYNDVIFQFRANSSTVSNVMCTIDAVNKQIIKNGIQSVSDHGDSASFSSEKYDANDDYPLIYVTADTTPCKVYVNRVTQTSSELIKTFVFPTDKAGYYGAHAYDEQNNIMYIVAYTEQNYQTDNGGSNKTLVSAWNMADLTDNGDGTFTPTFISSFTRPFIYVMQGQQFHDNMIWIASGYTGSTKSYIHAISPINGALKYTVDLNTTTEVEGMSFISDHDMVVGLAGGIYTKYTFAKKE